MLPENVAVFTNWDGNIGVNAVDVHLINDRTVSKNYINIKSSILYTSMEPFHNLNITLTGADLVLEINNKRMCSEMVMELLGVEGVNHSVDY